MVPTIHDVAKLANTSKSTVSRYLNGQKVKKTTQAALDRAIRELNFHRNAHARRLVTSKTFTIGIAIDDISNVFYSGMIKGIEDAVKKEGYNCIYYSWTSNFNREISFLDLLYEGQIDGLILVSFRRRQEEELQKIRESPLPVVLIGDRGGKDGIFSVDVDNAFGVSELVAYLHSIGHRNMAYITGPDHAAASKYRLKGYIDTLGALGIPYRSEWVVTSDWSNQGGYEAMLEINGLEGITAVLASNDETAVGAMRAIQESGRSVPEHMSIVGFDDISIAQWVYPALTTVRQPFFEIGNKAAAGLFDKIHGRPHAESASHLLRPKLIIRNSCANT